MISVVIPLYNKAQSIEKTIRCIQSQTYQDFEIVVVDGWSTDGSTEAIQRLAAEDARIRVLMQQDRHGVTPARNESVLVSRGEHIAFIDADDYWDPTYLEQMSFLIADYPNAGIWGMANGELCGNHKHYQPNNYSQQLRGIIDNPWLIGCPYWTGATVISRQAFDAVGGFDNRIIFGEDIDLWYRIMLRFPCVYDNTKVLSYYRIDAENRACNHVFPLEIHIPYYIDKYAVDRAANRDFRRFFDLQCLYRLYPYMFDKRYKKEALRIVAKIDFSLQKKTLYWRFKWPYLYRLYRRLRGITLIHYADYEGGRA